MIIILRENASDRKSELYEMLSGFAVEETSLGARTVLLVTGLTHTLDAERIAAFPFVERVEKDETAYLTSRGGDVTVRGVTVGRGTFTLIAGPCSVESREQTLGIARFVRENGAVLLRGGAFKPRTSPYSFAGLGEEGLRILSDVRRETGMPVVSEITDEKYLPLYEDVDVIQVGARNMQNFELLHALGGCGKPVLLKRGAGNTPDELLLSAEHLMRAGNDRIILCERGIRTFEAATRYTLDVSVIPVLKRRTGLPVIADPSHAAGDASLVEPLALAAVAAGADGVMVEVHDDPSHALCDGGQALSPARFSSLSEKIRALVAAVR